MIAHETLMFFGGSIGPWELLVVMLVVLLVFGRRVPEVMKSLGKGVTQFKRGLRDVEDEIMSEETHPEVSNEPKTIDHPASNDMTDPADTTEAADATETVDATDTTDTEHHHGAPSA